MTESQLRSLQDEMVYRGQVTSKETQNGEHERNQTTQIIEDLFFKPILGREGVMKDAKNCYLILTGKIKEINKESGKKERKVNLVLNNGDKETRQTVWLINPRIGAHNGKPALIETIIRKRRRHTVLLGQAVRCLQTEIKTRAGNAGTIEYYFEAELPQYLHLYDEVGTKYNPD